MDTSKLGTVGATVGVAVSQVRAGDAAAVPALWHPAAPSEYAAVTSTSILSAVAPCFLGW